MDAWIFACESDLSGNILALGLLDILEVFVSDCGLLEIGIRVGFGIREEGILSFFVGKFWFRVPGEHSFEAVKREGDTRSPDVWHGCSRIYRDRNEPVPRVSDKLNRLPPQEGTNDLRRQIRINARDELYKSG